MNIWYEVKVKYTKQFEDGRLKRVTEPYLVGAVSFTDAEARIYEEVGSNIQGEFIIVSITKKDFADIFYYDDCDDWWKLKVSYMNVDADSGKEKKTSVYMLVVANNLKEAEARLRESLISMTVNYDIEKGERTKIVEVLPYEPKDSE